MTTIIILSVLNILYEIFAMQLYDRFENFLRKFLFVICFMYFFSQINQILKNNVFYTVLQCSAFVLLALDFFKNMLIETSEEVNRNIISALFTKKNCDRFDCVFIVFRNWRWMD